GLAARRSNRVNCRPGDPVRGENCSMNRLFAAFIVGAMILGVLVGWACNQFLGADQVTQVASGLSILTDLFLRLIKMIIAPLVFATLVSGIAHMEDAAQIGRVGIKTMGWFILAS